MFFYNYLFPAMYILVSKSIYLQKHIFLNSVVNCNAVAFLPHLFFH